MQVIVARETTDALLVEAVAPNITDDLTAARSPEIDRHEIIVRFGAMTERIRAELSSGLNELAGSPAEAWTDELLRSVRALELVVEARGAVAEEYYAFFATMIDLRARSR